MKRTLIPTGLSLALATMVCACAATPPATVRVVKSLGALQCQQPRADDAATLARALSDAGLRLLSTTCGVDGRVYPAVCGAADGHVAVVEIAAADQGAAEGLGFTAMSALPGAQIVPCR